MSGESDTNKKVVSSTCHYDSSTNEIKCDVTLNDGTRHSLSAGVISDVSANSSKMKRTKKVDEN
jgi:hypothetical protein